MKIALIGYGKMGKTIERLALERGHSIAFRIDADNAADLLLLSPTTCDVAIEFTRPETAFSNISQCLEQGVKILSGTTGWLDQLQTVEALCRKTNGTFMYSANYSLGVNLFFELNKWLADKMKSQGQYTLQMEEIHHTEKLDSPSGTALRLVEGIKESNPVITGWSHGPTTDRQKIGIISHREPNVPGTHTVQYHTPLETIEIKHTAHSRDLFAAGAVDAAEWLHTQRGFKTMNDYLNDLT